MARRPAMNRQIIYICAEYAGVAPRSGGIGHAMRGEAEWFAAAGADVTVLCPCVEYSRERVVSQNGVSICILPLGGVARARAILERIQTVRRVRSLLTDRQPALVIAPEYSGPVPYKGFSQPLIVQIHGSATLLAAGCGHPARGVIRNLECRTAAQADHIQAVSRYAATETARVFGLVFRSVSVVPNTVDTVTFQPARACVDRSRLLYVTARLSEVKGLYVLAEVADRTLTAHERATLTVIGRDDSKGSMRAAFIARVAPALRSRISFIDSCSRSELAVHMAGCAFVIVPSLVETFSMVCIEAMASGRPVVASDRGGIPEVVESGVSGILADPAAPQTFVTAVGELLRNPALADRMGEQGRRFAETRYRPDVVYRQTAAIHDALLERLGRRAPNAFAGRLL
ncbi:MAG: glycosyltransferase family 4 protein [Bryobacterales bacterium]|nr:glycosyltransferase family 4 protein [Bryobacterales bacterium]